MASNQARLSWDDFRLIKAIAEARTLPSAAFMLGVNHSTVFRRLKQIEDTLGVAPFEKHRSGYTLTAVGEEVVELAKRLDEEIASVMRKLAGQEISPSGELRIATNDTLLVHLLTPIFSQFREQCPDIRLDILIGNQALNLSKRDADVAIRATDKPPETLVGRRAAHIAWALYAKAGTKPALRPSDGGIDLSGHCWVSPGEQMGSLKLVKWLLAHVPSERLVYKVNTVLGLAEAVEAGAGIGYLPCFIGDARKTLQRLAPPRQEFGTDLWLLTHSDLRHAPRVRAFLDFLGTEIAKRRVFIEGETV